MVSRNSESSSDMLPVSVNCPGLTVAFDTVSSMWFNSSSLSEQDRKLMSENDHLRKDLESLEQENELLLDLCTAKELDIVQARKLLEDLQSLFTE